MESITTVRKMMVSNRIIVPSYQRAYSWDTPEEKLSERKTQTDVFLSDLEEYIKSDAISPYYFGHFIFEKNNGQLYCVIDGQQRLTTIVIILSALFAKLKSIRSLSEEEETLYEDMIRRKSRICFSTVDYDDQLFIDHVIDQKPIQDPGCLPTESARRSIRALSFFREKLSEKSESYLKDMLSTVCQSACTTHVIQNESEAIQMFLFQNNRGKRPSNLEIVKAQFMYSVHLHGNDERDALLKEIKARFDAIYKSIALIERRIDEDDVLIYSLRVHLNSLLEDSVLVKIQKELSGQAPLNFIKSFSESLAASFGYLSNFFGKHERDRPAIHSFIILGGMAPALPFIIKAYKYGLSIEDIEKICSSMENLVLRHRLIGTRADIKSRLQEVFKGFTENNKDLSPIIGVVDLMKRSSDWWWAYWNNEKLAESLQGPIDHGVAKYLLWKYEIHLGQQGEHGYSPPRFDSIKSPELEHIAPMNEPEKQPHGYDNYDEEFKSKYIDCLGNYLLLSKSHNCAVGNIPFAQKWVTYKSNYQQREIQKLVSNPESGVWDKGMIQHRKDKILGFIMDHYQ